MLSNVLAPMSARSDEPIYARQWVRERVQSCVPALVGPWRAWQRRRRIARLPAIRIEATANYYKAWTSPNPDYKVTIHNAEGDSVGTACYAFSPLSDQVYLFEIEIAAEHRRRGYATALLWRLALIYRQPITVVKELYSGHQFWAAARRLRGAGLVVTAPFSVGDMDAESRRWRHLQPEQERLEKLIHERLFRHEPWAVAVGRGLGFLGRSGRGTPDASCDGSHRRS